MSSPELRESSARMLEVTGGRWPKNVLIPRAAGEDNFTSRMARELKVFPYERNIAAVVSAVMERDRQDAAQKRRAVVRIADPMREAKRARGSAKSAASGGSRLVPAAKPDAPVHSKASASVKVATSGGSKAPLGGAVKGRRPPSPARRVADFGTDISVEDYLVGKLKLLLLFFDEVFNQYHGAGSGEGQLAVVPPTVATTLPTAVVGARGAARDPWANFCMSGEILSAAAAKDVAGSMSQRLREASQQLKQVSCVGLRCLLFLCGFESHGFMCQVADFADLVALGALTADVATEVERLWAQHADAVREKSAAESKNRRLSEKVAAMEAEKTDLLRKLAEERREVNKAITDA
jgi:hypothetical protein